MQFFTNNPILQKHNILLEESNNGKQNSYFKFCSDFYAPTLKGGGGHLELHLSLRPKMFNFVTEVAMWEQQCPMDTFLVFIQFTLYYFNTF